MGSDANLLVAPKLACSRLSNSGGERKIGASKEKKRGRGAGAGAEGEPVRLSLMDRFWYTSSWYTLSLVNFDSFCQHPQSA